MVNLRSLMLESHLLHLPKKIGTKEIFFCLLFKPPKHLNSLSDLEQFETARLNCSIKLSLSR